MNDKIERAGETDAPHIIDLLKETARWLQNRGIEQWGYLLSGGEDRQIEAAAAAGEMYMVRREDTLIAVFSLYAGPRDWDLHLFGEDVPDQAVFLHKFAVRPAFMGTGIGAGLLGWIERYLMDRFNYLLLDCVSENKKLNDFYRNAGFEYAGQAYGHNKYRKKLTHHP